MNEYFWFQKNYTKEKERERSKIKVRKTENSTYIYFFKCGANYFMRFKKRVQKRRSEML